MKSQSHIQPQRPPRFSLPFFIARRYLRSKHSLNFISVISTISIVGITIGVAALVIVMSLFNGFQALIERFLVGFDPHVRISVVQKNSPQSSAFLTINDSLETLVQTALQSIQPNNASISAAAVASGKVVCINARSMQAFQLVGIDESKARQVSGIAQTVVVGQFSLESSAPNLVNLVMGASLADKLRIVSGDTVQLLSPYALEAAITQGMMPRSVRAVVIGIFQSNNKEYDGTQAYTSLASARRLLRLPPDAAQSLDIRLDSYTSSVEAQRRLQAVLPPTMLVQTWFDLHRDLYVVMRFERLAAFCVLLIIVLVAVFNVFASLSMTVAEKRAEIGMLKAMGASSRLVTTIFFSQSVLVGVIGTALGATLGVALCLGQMHYGWLALDTSRYVVPMLPLIVDWRDVGVVCAVALTLSVAAGFVPARKAGEVRSAVALLRKERV
jgi:lipoprotein-releasing system permease protein